MLYSSFCGTTDELFVRLLDASLMENLEVRGFIGFDIRRLLFRFEGNGRLYAKLSRFAAMLVLRLDGGRKVLDDIPQSAPL